MLRVKISGNGFKVPKVKYKADKPVDVQFKAKKTEVDPTKGMKERQPEKRQPEKRQPEKRQPEKRQPEKQEPEKTGFMISKDQADKDNAQPRPKPEPEQTKPEQTSFMISRKEAEKKGKEKPTQGINTKAIRQNQKRISAKIRKGKAKR